jgi:enoyl-CoA hydratase/carnithine racemase
MTKYFSVPLEAGSEVEILFEQRNSGAEAQAFGFADDVIEKSAATMGEALDMVRSIATCAMHKLKDLDVAGAEATIGLKLSGKGKFVLAEVNAEATLSVKITLKK